MDLTPYVDILQRHLSAAAAAGGDEARELAERLTASLDAAARLALLGALSDAADEISAELAPGAVDVRLRRGEPEFVVSTPAEPPENAATAPAPEPPPEPGATSRTTLRLPDQLKAQVEVAAARDGASVNTWLVRAVSAEVERSTGTPTRPQRGSRHITGWVR